MKKNKKRTFVYNTNQLVKRIIITTFFFGFVLVCFAQVSLTISEIRDQTSTYLNQSIQTHGIVSGIFQGENQIGGFFIQDKKGIFIKSSSLSVNIGDSINVIGTLQNSNNRAQINDVSSLHIVSSNNKVSITKVVFPTDFNSYEQYEGMLLEFDQTLTVTNNYNLFKYGELTLSSARLYTPTYVALPLSNEYNEVITNNYTDRITLDDASSETYPSNNIFLDKNGTRRIGSHINNLHGIIDQIGSDYYIYSPDTVKFYGNERTTTHENIGNYSIKVCFTNLEMFKTSYWGDGYGANNETEFNKQRTKVLAALNAIDADIYALCEIQQGSVALQNLVNGLNALRGENIYSFINEGDKTTSYVKSAFIYKNTTVKSYLNLITNNNFSSTWNRKKAQGFIEKSSNQKFIVCVNHYKAKSGCPADGDNADQNDGQGCYNAMRTSEAKSSLEFITYMKNYVEDNDVLFVGDLNSYRKEDPIITLINGGLIDEQARFHGDSAYSYVYQGTSGYLDYALASQSMNNQITGVTAWHVNTDEPSSLQYSSNYYQPNLYRYSDHDPLIVGLSLVTQPKYEPITDNPKLFPNPADGYTTITNANGCEIEIIALTGQLIFKTTAESNYQIISSEFLSSGLYIIQVSGTKNAIFKLIKK